MHPPAFYIVQIDKNDSQSLWEVRVKSASVQSKSLQTETVVSQ